jgi:ribosomal protein S18 acetylase RimI-like enzyme
MRKANTDMTQTSQAYTIKFATENDARELLELSRQTFIDTFGPHNTPENMRLYVESTFTLDEIKKELKDANSTFILTQEGNQLIGYAKLRDNKNPDELRGTHAIEIERIYSIQAYLGKNVGKALMQACLDLARSRGYSVIWLGVWEHNPRAIRFYEKYGFEKFSSHPFWLGNDLQTDLLMKRSL